MLALTLLAFAPARPAGAAPPGPPINEPTGALAAAFECSPGLSGTARPPVLLVHGTGSNVEESWSWGYRHVLPQLGIPTCTVELPNRALTDIQRSVEYVVYATRQMAAASGRRVSVVGHSQGGLHPVWALQFWPDLADVVDDVVAFGTPYQGTEAGKTAPCAETGCPPAVWQQTVGSNLVQALNRHAPPASPSYTSIATLFDQVATPQPGASRLAGARQIVIQDLCPGRPTEHFSLAGDAVVYALVLDALQHAGPANPARIPPTVCEQSVFRGADVAKMLLVLPIGVTSPLLIGSSTTEQVKGEPRLRCYADPGCSKLAAVRHTARKIRNGLTCPREGPRRGRIIKAGCHPRSTRLHFVGGGAGFIRVTFERLVKKNGKKRKRWVGAGVREIPLRGGRQRLSLSSYASPAQGLPLKRLRSGRYRMVLATRALAGDPWLREVKLPLAVRKR